MKTYELRQGDEVVLRFACEHAEMGKNQWMVKILNKSGILTASIYLGLDISFYEIPAPDKSSPASN